MNEHTLSATSEPSNEVTIDGGKKLQVKRMSKLPVHIGKTGGIRQHLNSQLPAAHQGLKNHVYVSMPAENFVHAESSKDKENKHGQIGLVKSQDMQHRYINSSFYFTQVYLKYFTSEF